MSLPTMQDNPSGLHRRYNITKASGEPVDPGAEYFVLRLDAGGSDPHHIEACRRALREYALWIHSCLPDLANDIWRRYPGPETAAQLPEDPQCQHCGKDLYDFSDIGCGHCDPRATDPI